jgi:hypothetical protein
MADKIIRAVSRWEQIIKLFLLIIAGVGIIWGVGGWKVKAETMDANHELRIGDIEKRDIVRDSLLVQITSNVKDITLELKMMREDRNNWEEEHIELLKRAKIFPKRLYRGQLK